MHRQRLTAVREVANSLATRRILRTLLPASPLLFGVPVALGIAISVVKLVGVSHPFLGWATTVNNDAEELYRGHTLYQNPAQGYTGLLYTPLYPALLALLYHVYFWRDWPLLVVYGASVSLVILVARVAYAPTGPAAKPIRALAATGIGLMAYWCVLSIRLPALSEARADQLAWALALCGLIAVADFGPAPSRRRVTLAALLLTAGIWAKQTTVGVAALALAWVLALAAVSALSRRSALLFAAVLGGANLGLLLALDLLTNGWAKFILIEMATRQATRSLYGTYLREGLQSSALAIAFVAATSLAIVVNAAIRRRRNQELSRSSTFATLRAGLHKSLLADDPTARRIALLGLNIVLGFALAVYILRKQGTQANHFIGVVWMLGLLAAAGWRLSQRRIGTAVPAGGCIALCFGMLQLGPVRSLAARGDVIVPDLEHAVDWPPMQPWLLSWTKKHSYYWGLMANLNARPNAPLYPDFINLADKLAAGYQPMYLVRALLNRSFESVSFFELAEEPYTSAYGKWEEGYLWKLDEIIAARYVQAPWSPQGVLVRRPGPERDAWMRDCFAPFLAAGTTFRIHHGGGFWCSFSPGHLQLVKTPTPLSEVVTTQPVNVSGTVAASIENRPSAQFNLVLGEGGGNWTANIESEPGHSHRVEISTYLGKALLGSTIVPQVDLRGQRPGVRLRLVETNGRPGPPVSTGSYATTLTVPATRSPLAIVASQGATIDLSALKLSH